MPILEAVLELGPAQQEDEQKHDRAKENHGGGDGYKDPDNLAP